MFSPDSSGNPLLREIVFFGGKLSIKRSRSAEVTSFIADLARYHLPVKEPCRNSVALSLPIDSIPFFRRPIIFSSFVTRSPT
jgi:hypothetical protein